MNGPPWPRAPRVDRELCRVVEVDGEPVRVRGAQEMTDQEQGYLADVVRAARIRMEEEAAAEPPHLWVLINSSCGHVGGYSNTKSMMLAFKTRLTIYGHKHWTVEDRPEADETELQQLIDGVRCRTCRFSKKLIR